MNAEVLQSTIDLYSTITIILIIAIGVTGLALWYWSGQR